MTMGKVRRKKCKFHITAPNSANTLDTGEDNGEMETNISSLYSVTPIPGEFLTRLPFVSLHSNKDGETKGKEVEGEVERCVGNSEGIEITSRFQKQCLEVKKKKDKRKLRHEKWLQKMETCRLAKEAIKATEKRKKTVIVGDLRPLISALPDIDTTVHRIHHESFKGKSKRRKGKRMTDSRQKPTVLCEVEHFKQVLVHPMFQSDPLGTISEHIRNATALNRI